MNSSADVLQISDLSKRFGDKQVLSSLDLAVSPGERVAIVGPNGSGKTTLLRCIAGTLLPDHGSLTVAGFPPGSLEAQRRTGVSLSQERSFYLRLTGLQNLRFFARIKGISADAAPREVGSLIEELELKEIVVPRMARCSTGMLQQVSLARSLLGSPQLILLDEPTRSLDQDARERLWKALERRTGSGIMVATHLPSDIERCTRVIDLAA
ncbi:MAG TPA: ABC transporter ATP-binding protein [Actinomycetota bacterium]|nr:ABC transporter ATP-binding protein [Actinomycetota bacterium]